MFPCRPDGGFGSDEPCEPEKSGSTHEVGVEELTHWEAQEETAILFSRVGPQPAGPTFGAGAQGGGTQVVVTDTRHWRSVKP